jgi:hypothetical protein
VSRPDRVTVMSRSTRQSLEKGRPTSGPPTWIAPAADSPSDTTHLAVLLRVHRLLALRTMATAFAGLFGVPLVLSQLPDLTGVTLLGVPVLWGLLGAGAYPLLFLLGRHHALRAEQVDDQLSRPS